MSLEATTPCANCERSSASRCAPGQAGQLQATRRSSRSNWPPPARTPPLPPSLPPPTSSSRPSRLRLPDRTNAASAASPAIPSTNAALFPPEQIDRASPMHYPRRLPLLRGTTASQLATTPASSSRSNSRAVPVDRSRNTRCTRVLVRPLPQGPLRRPCPPHRQGRPGRPSADHPDRLPQGRSATPPSPPSASSSATWSQVTISRGQLSKVIAKVSDGPGRALPGVARLPARRSRRSTWTRPATRTTASGCGPGASGPAVHPVQDRPAPLRRRADRGAGQGVRRGAGLRLLQRLPPLHARVRRDGAVLPGPSDPRREVPDDAAGQAGAGLRRALARGVADACSG